MTVDAPQLEQDAQIIVRVPASDIEDVDVFEEMRREAYGEKDPERRLGAFAALAASADIGSTDTRVEELVLDGVTREDGKTIVAAAMKRAEEDARTILGSHSDDDAKPQAGYDFVIGSTGVEEIRKVTIFPQDDDKTRWSREVQDRVGSGPKQNKVSGRLKGPIDPRTRRVKG